MALSIGSPLRINLLLLSLSTTHAFAGVTNRAGWTELSSPLAHDRVHVRRLDEAVSYTHLTLPTICSV